MAKFSLKALSLRNMPRKAILGIAAVLAVTGATGAAALLAPANFSQALPSVSAQTFTPSTTDDISSQLPFDRVAQTSTPQDDAAPARTPEIAQPPLPTSTATPARRTTDATPTNRTARDFDRLIRRAPTQATDTPSDEAPIARTTASQPQGRMIPTAAPGVISQTPVAQTRIATPVAKKIIRPRVVYTHHEMCNE